MNRDNERQSAIILSVIGIIPVVWLALLIAPSVKGGLPEILPSLLTAFNEPFHIELCEDSLKTVLVLLLCYAMGIGIYFSTQKNYRRREEHGSAKWGNARAVNKKYRQSPASANIGLALLVLFFVVGVVRTCGSFTDVKKPEHALKLFIRFAIAKGVITYGLELMLALFDIVQGTISTIMTSAGFGTLNQTTLPAEMVTTIESCGFFESIPLWAVTLIGGLFITVLSFIMIMTVYGRFFKLYMYTALAPIPLSTFAGEPSQNVGKSFIKSYCAVLLEGAVIVLACIIFSLFASTPPVVNPDAAAVTQVWAYIGELVFNMLVLVGAVKMSDRIIREMMGL